MNGTPMKLVITIYCDNSAFNGKDCGRELARILTRWTVNLKDGEGFRFAERLHDKEGKVSTVRYEAVNAMLLNEFLKEHRKVENLEATVADLAEQLQKLTARVEMKNSSRRVAGK